MSPDRKLRVLIADDVHETRRSTRLMVSTLERLEVAAIASDGRQAVDMAREQKPDLLLMDINMPALDGLSAIREILKFAPETACIITSAERSPDVLRAAMALGVQEYLVKPFTIEELDAAVLRAAARRLEAIERNAKAEDLRRKNEAWLKQLGAEYIRSRRSDDQAVEVFEQLAAFPGAETRWVQSLAIIYVLRQDWQKLKTLVDRITHTES